MDSEKGNGKNTDKNFVSRLIIFVKILLFLAIFVGMTFLFDLVEKKFSYITGRILQYVIVGVPAALLIRYAVISQDKDRRKRGKDDLQRITKRDLARKLSKESPNRQFEDIFWKYKQNWNDQAFSGLKTYATDNFYKQTEYLQAALRSIGRTFTLDDIDLKHFDPYNVKDKVGTAEDTLLFQVSYEATLTLNEDDVEIAQRRHLFYEFWYFVRSGNDWRLDQMASRESGIGGEDKRLANFATEHDLVRTFPPLGVLLPRTGALFEGRSSLVGGTLKEWLDFQFNVQPGEVDNTIGVQDHYVGKWRGAVVQLYTYIANNSFSSTFGYVPVAQISLPKDYGHIVVRPKSLVSKFDLDPSYEQMSLEWPDFNKRYDVFATDKDLLASLELINPDFMAFLYDHLPSACLEVQGSNVYIYAVATEKPPTEQVFEGLFGIA
ncbi:MAG: hypothetical protein ABWX94_03740, partial [Candidatus Saccharimonadales bacterium]